MDPDKALLYLLDDLHDLYKELSTLNSYTGNDLGKVKTLAYRKAAHKVSILLAKHEWRENV